METKDPAPRTLMPKPRTSGEHAAATSISDAARNAADAIPQRDGYRSLLTGSRVMRRDHAMARDAWFHALKVERKAEVLFELEVLLKGLACFANPRNHPGPPRRTAIVAVDFRDALLIARDGLAHVITLARTLLQEEERVFLFQRYLEHEIPEDSARSKFVRASASQETPQDALVAIRHGFSHVLEVIDAVARQPKVSFRTFFSILGLVQREVARNSFFNPITALEFRPEFDRIKSAEVFDLVQTVAGDEAHRLVALSFLALFRMIRYLDLVESFASEVTPSRAYLALAALRSDARALSGHLRGHSGAHLAEGFEREVFSMSSRAVGLRYEALLAEGHRLLGIKGALEGIAAKVRLEVRRAYERDVPAVDAATTPMELRKRLLVAADALRPALRSTEMFLCKALGAKLDAHFVFDDGAAKREVGERLRRDVWMFAQIVRGFAAKAAAVPKGDRSDRWAGVESFRFVKEFLSYFRSMGYPLLRSNDYPRFDQFMAAVASLEELDLLEPARFAAAVRECETFYGFLMQVFDSISKRDELAGTPFDKRAAAEALKMYLGG